MCLMIYFNQGKAKKVVQAQKLWFEVLKSQIETGTPYMLFKVSNNTSLRMVLSIISLLLL